MPGHTLRGFAGVMRLYTGGALKLFPPLATKAQKLKKNFVPFVLFVAKRN
jgi:hypothetical protein